MQFDVIIVGAGNAALCAALSAREQGAKVLVLEHAPKAQRGGNSVYSGGAFRVVYNGAEDVKRFVPDLTMQEIASSDFGEYTAQQYLDDLGRVTQYHIDPDLAEVLVDRSADTVHWLRKHKVRFVLNHNHTFKHEGRFKFSSGIVISAVGGGRALVESEFKAAEEQGIAILYDAEAIALIRGRLGIEGVRARIDGIEENVNARAVVLACGGFEANREWRVRYLGPGWDLAKVRGTRYNTGAGIRMALDNGAQSYGHWSGCHAISMERYTPDFGDLDNDSGADRDGYPFGIMINADGKRFVDEGADMRAYTYAKYGRMVLQQPGSCAWQVFDAQWTPFKRPEYKMRTVTKVQASTLAELVQRMEDVNPSQFLETVRHYNAAIRRDVPFNPNIKDGRCTIGLEINKSNWANPIEVPPFEAYAIGTGITFTFGGVKIDKAARVLNTADAALPGLYAAGEMVGGLFYFTYPGATGLMSGAVFGRIAGHEAALYARNAQPS